MPLVDVARLYLRLERNSEGQFMGVTNVGKSWLEDQYLHKKKSMQEIAEMVGCSAGGIQHLLRRYGIPIRSLSEARKGRLNPFYGRKWTETMKKKHYKRRKIKTSKEELEKLYWEKGLTIPEIAEMFGVAVSTAWLTFKRGGIPLRSRSETLKRNWRRREYRRKVVRGVLESSFKRPTGAEAKLIEIIEKNALPFKYVGNGQQVIAGLCPDFVHNGDRMVIEVFGDYWHSEKNPKLTWNRTVEGRKKIFSKAGYRTLIIWEHELEDEASVLRKVSSFMGGGDLVQG